MIKITIMLVIVIIFSTFVFAQPVVPPDQTGIELINKIDREHQNTRVFIQNELKAREDSFLEEFTARADYYEGAVESMINGFLIKMSAVLVGSIFFVVAVLNLIRNKTEKKKYEIFKQSLKQDLVVELKKDFLELPERELKMYEKALMKETKPEKEKKSWSPFKKKQKEEFKVGNVDHLFKKPTNVLDKMKGVGNGSF